MGSEENKVADADSSDKEKSKYGEPAKYDPAFRGPIKKRSCTDILCCFLFIIFVLGMFVVGYFAYLYGDPVKLIYPSNSAGNLCGYGDLASKPYLLFFDLLVCARLGPAVINGCPTPQVCVEKCPTSYWAWYPQSFAEESAAALPVGSAAALTTAKALRSKMLCIDGVNAVTSPKSVKGLIDDNECAPYYVDSEPLLYRCMPSIFSTLLNSTVDLVASTDGGTTNFTMTDKYNNSVTGDALKTGAEALTVLLNAASYGEKILNDIVASWHLLLIGCAIACVFCFIWIVIMRWIAGIMVWITIAAFIGLFAFSCYYCYSTYYELKNSSTANTEVKFTTDLDYWKNLKTTWLVLGCTSATLLIIILLVLIFLRERIQIAIALIKEASRAVGKMMFTLLWPVVPWLLQVIVFAYFVGVATFLASTTVQIKSSSNETTANLTGSLNSGSTPNVFNLVECNDENSTASSICNFVQNKNSEYTTYLQFYNLFMWFWVMNFIVAFGQMVLAGAFASFYWAFNKPDDIPAFAVTQSVGRTLFYHTGSLAFGALIIAIIQIIRVMLEYLDNKLKGTENQVAKFILKCLKCCFWCLEKFMKMINKNAYILIAVYGKNFCVSAKNAFFLIMRNIVRVVVIDKVTDFILFIGKLVVVGAVGGGSYYFFSGSITKTIPALAAYVPSDLNFWVLPIILITIITYMIASGFFSVYGMCVDTLFLCFLEDLERHDGSAEKPYYMNKELMNILGKKNKVEKKE